MGNDLVSIRERQTRMNYDEFLSHVFVSD